MYVLCDETEVGTGVYMYCEMGTGVYMYCEMSQRWVLVYICTVR